MHKDKDNIFSIAPMMDWTDRHCRYFHRLISPNVLLYTEMVTANAAIHGDRQQLLGYDDTQHPIALQLGGSAPQLLAQATQIGFDYGYDEINLNVGCPSDRVQSGCFGAALMRDPSLVVRCCAAMIKAAGSIPVTVKCRIGVDTQEPAQVLPEFITQIADAGVSKIIIHARKAWLSGLSPKQNRTIPPLDYDLVHQIKAQFPHLTLILNGGLNSAADAMVHINAGLDGAMFGRSAYHDPYRLLAEIEHIINPHQPTRTRAEVVAALLPYIARHIHAGGRLHHITRHILGLFAHQSGARHWRQYLSQHSTGAGADQQVVRDALDRVGDIAGVL